MPSYTRQTGESGGGHCGPDDGPVTLRIAEDGDPIDVLNLVDQPSFPGCLREVRPVGMLELIDESEVDRKILAVPVSNPRFDQIRTMEEVPEHVRLEVEHFFEIYKELEGETVRTHGWQSLEAAREAIRKSRDRFVSARNLVTVPRNK